MNSEESDHIARIAFAAEAAYTPGGSAGPWFDDQLLADALEAAGHEAAIISWEDGRVDLLLSDAIFVSSTWNGCADPPAFRPGSTPTLLSRATGACSRARELRNVPQF